MRSISFYNTRGEIHTSMQGDESALQLTIENFPDPWVEGDWFDKGKYVLNGDVLDRPLNPTTLSGLTLNNVPVPAEVWIDRVRYDTNEPVVEIAFQYPGKHKIRVVSFPYLDAEFDIENYP